MQPPITRQGRRWASIRASARAASWRWWMRRAGCWRRAWAISRLPNHEAQKARAKAQILGMIRRHKVHGCRHRQRHGLPRERTVHRVPAAGSAGAWLTSSSARRARSVYSASKLAAKEFPEYDVSLRSAVSIARRMQDPLAELVKIDPKAIGVGQYQHDHRNRPSWTNALSGVVENCVNSVGVDVDTASASLLTLCRGHRRQRWQRTLWPIGTKTALPQPRRSSKRCRSWGRRRLSSARASCASSGSKSAGRDGGASRKAMRRRKALLEKLGYAPQAVETRRHRRHSGKGRTGGHGEAGG